MKRVGVIGATGYTGLELLKRLAHHPHAKVTRVTSRETVGQELGQVHPVLAGRFDLKFTALDIPAFCDEVDLAFSCLPHAASAEIVMQLLEHGCRVIDFSADYRLNDLETYESWYNTQHPDPNRVGQVPYGIPELFRDSLRDTPLIANPGCFPSSAILPLMPLLRDRLVNTEGIIVDAKTGVSGAGRKPSLKFHYPECNESIVAYGIGTHRHMPEIDQIMQRRLGVSTSVVALTYARYPHSDGAP